MRLIRLSALAMALLMVAVACETGKDNKKLASVTGSTSQGDRRDVCARDLSVRKSPDGEAIGTLYQGETFSVDRYSDTRKWAYGFAYGQVNKKGWVLAQYLGPCQPTSPTSQPTSPTSSLPQGSSASTGRSFAFSVPCIREGRLDCSLDDWTYSTWTDRLNWLRGVQERYPQYTGSGTGSWLNVFKGVVRYFAESKIFRISNRAKAIDAGILYQLQQGLAAALNRETFLNQGAASRWEAFFVAHRDNPGRVAMLKRLWGLAETAGTETGLRHARKFGFKSKDEEYMLRRYLLHSTNDYRQALVKGTWVWDLSVNPPLRHWPDPRKDEGWAYGWGWRWQMQHCNKTPTC